MWCQLATLEESLCINHSDLGTQRKSAGVKHYTETLRQREKPKSMKKEHNVIKKGVVRDKYEPLFFETTSH